MLSCASMGRQVPDSRECHTMKQHARLVLVAAVAAAVALSGCSGVPSLSTGSGGRSATASSSPEQPQSFLTRLEAAAATQETVEIFFSAEKIDGSGTAVLGDDPAGRYVINIGDTNTLMVIVDGVAYFKDGADFSARWMSMPARGVAIAQTFTPQQLFATMRSSATSVEDLGPDDLYGTPTTRYELIADNSGVPSSTGVAAALLDTAAPSDTVYSLWVGEDDLMRRVEVITPSGDLILEYARWGESMEVVAPPAGEVGPAPSG